MRTLTAAPAARLRLWHFDAVLLAAAALAANLLAARFITHPGYVDAYYYFGGAVQLARGAGFTEPYRWNYLAAGDLARDVTPPWPSHLYWMPLTSAAAAPFIAAAERLAGTRLGHDQLFRAAQVPFVAAAVAMPLAAYAVARRLSGLRRHAQTAGWLTVFSPFYFIYWPNTDAFALHGLAAVGALYAAAVAGEAGTGARRWALAAGLCAGLAHLARADGALVLAVVVAWLAWSRCRERAWGVAATAAVVGYLLVMAPWFWRNWLVAGQPLTGGAQTLWLREYNELFNYPADDLTARHLFSTGWAAVLAGRWAALRDNLTTLAVVQGGLVAFPFALLGLWRCRRTAHIQLGAVYGLALLALMSLAFSFSGARGGYFHSGAALLPLLMAAAPIGLDAAVDAAARRLPHWQPERSKPIFAALLIVSLLVLTLVVYTTRVIGPDPQRPRWAQAGAAYAAAGAWLAEHQVSDGLVVVNDPPGWYYWSERPGIVIPNGGPADLLRLMDDYDARWVILDVNVPAGLRDAYVHPESQPGLLLRARFESAAGIAYLLERDPGL